ncbi:SOS response-associated peptidase [Schlesneria sp. T3-172]|uniref:SOS response-associated peptidase n=1 Tax=Schlesneria sphaerica TaxID=3373610 RepID=UPI0037C97A7C
MCGRITSKVTPQDLQEFFDVVRFDDSIDWTPRYNVAPTTQVICVKGARDGREAFPARLGLIPSWAKDLKIAASTFNARSDTVATKPMFRSAFKARRCLVIASGFYEWKKLDAKNKQPYYITRTNGQPMAMAGLHEWWKSPEGEEIVSCTICTTEANEMMSELHDRMPVILTNDQIAPWLDTSINDVPALETLLTQFPAEGTQAWAVSKEVGNVRNQGERLMTAVPE